MNHRKPGHPNRHQFTRPGSVGGIEPSRRASTASYGGAGAAIYPPQHPLARTRAAFSSDTASSNPGELEESLLRLIHEHNHFSLKLRDSTERAENNAIRSASRLSDLLVDTVNSGVQNAFVNEERIEMEIRALTETIVQYGKHAATQAINTAIKEIGDFENWMKTIEYASRSVAAAIRNIHEA